MRGLFSQHFPPLEEPQAADCLTLRLPRPPAFAACLQWDGKWRLCGCEAVGVFTALRGHRDVAKARRIDGMVAVAGTIPTIREPPLDANHHGEAP
jgi:hypothetical protein